MNPFRKKGLHKEIPRKERKSLTETNWYHGRKKDEDNKTSREKEQRKESLDSKLEGYIGVLRSPIEMVEKLEAIPIAKQKDALATQIKYCIFVLGTKIHDKGLLQLQCGKEKFMAEQLKVNLESISQRLVQREPQNVYLHV